MSRERQSDDGGIGGEFAADGAAFADDDVQDAFGQAGLARAFANSISWPEQAMPA